MATTPPNAVPGQISGGQLHSPSMVAYIERHAHENPERMALIDGGTQEAITYGALVARIHAAARVLEGDGIGHGDRVGVLSPNSLPYVVLLLALAELGAIAVPQNTRLSPGEVAANLSDAGVSAVVGSVGLAETSTEAAQMAGVKRLYLLDGEAAGWTALPQGEVGLVPGRRGPAQEPSGEDTCTLLYTSGTTGVAKGCMLAQRTWIGYAMNMQMALRLGRDDTYLAFLPFFHVAGLGLMLSQLILGGCVVTQAAADPGQMHSNIRRHRVTVTMVVPGISGPFVNHPDAPGPAERSLRLVVSGAGLEQQAVMDAVVDRLGAEYIAIYGQTESGTKTTWATYREIRDHPGTYGRVMPSMVYRIVDENDEDVPVGEPGELLLRGPTVMQGYWGRPEDTAETLRNGWHHTGDVFVYEGDGLVRMVDRTKYLIKTGGENVYPQEVENVLKQHPGVADVAVAGIPDAHWGETVKAFVVPRPGMEPQRADLDAFVRGSLAGYKAPRYIEFVEVIPRNVSGKILKNDLVARPTDASQLVKPAQR